MTCALLALIGLVAAAPARAADCLDEQTVTITDEGFLPQRVCIISGGFVRFVHEGTTPQTVSDYAGLFESGTVAPGETYKLLLEVAGFHAYRSNRAPLLTGEIIVAVTELAGNEVALANDNIPDLPFPPTNESEVSEHPRWGFRESRVHLLVGFDADATVAEANAALAAADVRIVGGSPNLGILLVAAPDTADFSALYNARATLKASGAVAYASTSAEVQEDEIPRPLDEPTILDLLLPSYDTPHPAIEWEWYPAVHPEGLGAGADGNWNLESIRAPQAWNWREHIIQKGNHDAVVTGLVELGIALHDDLLASRNDNSQLCRALPSGLEQCTNVVVQDHAILTGGIIAATHDNDGVEDGTSLGVSGVNPHARLRSVGSSWNVGPNLGLWADLISIMELLIEEPEIRVVSMSLGVVLPDPERWWVDKGTSPDCGPGDDDDRQPGSNLICRPDNEDEWLSRIQDSGRTAMAVSVYAASRGVMFIKSAGNDSTAYCDQPAGEVVRADCEHFSLIEAPKATSFGWASAHWEEEGAPYPNPIVLAEALQRDHSRSGYSNVGGDLSAPADYIARLARNFDEDVYDSIIGGGTSSAAPHIAGVAGMMLAFDPSLTNVDVLGRLLDWSVPDTTDAAQPRLDAYASMMSIPGAGRALVDVNGDSADGNQRVRRGPPTPENLFGVPLGFDFHSNSVQDPTTGRLYRTAPDGVIDMRDFRRFRDAWIQICVESNRIDSNVNCTGLTNPGLDGPETHNKFDLNFDGCVWSPENGCPREWYFNRFDFNGDGLLALDLDFEREVPILADGSPAPSPDEASMMSDLDVLVTYWDPDPDKTEGWQSFQLRQLMNSQDVIFRADQFFDQGAGPVTLRVESPGSIDYPTRVIPPGGEIIYTFPVGQVVEVIPSAEIGGEIVEGDRVGFNPLIAGGDAALDICKRSLVVRASPPTVQADSNENIVITAEVIPCGTDSIQPTVSFSWTPSGAEDGAILFSPVDLVPSGERLLATTQFRPGANVAEYTITAHATVTRFDGRAIELEESVTVATEDSSGVYYRWRQQMLSYQETGSNRWGPETPDPPGAAGDCDAVVRERWIDGDSSNGIGAAFFVEFQDGVQVSASAPADYERDGNIVGWYRCIDHWSNVLTVDSPVDDNAFKLEREGRLRLVGGRVALTESVNDHSLAGRYEMRSSFSTPFPTTTLDDLSGDWSARIVPERLNQFVDHVLPEDVTLATNPDGLVLTNLRELGDLNYEYDGSWEHTGTLDTASINETLVARSNSDIPSGIATPLSGTMQREYLLVSRPDRSGIRHNADDATELRFARGADGEWEKYSYCEVVERDDTREPLYVSETQAGYEGGTHGWWRRNETFLPLDHGIPNTLASAGYEYPQPVGPVQSQTRYAFVAIPYDSEAELQAMIDGGELDLPECDAGSMPSADFIVEVSPSEEGDVVYFSDVSSASGNSIVSRLWRFGDGTESTERNPSHRYPDDGDYTVELEITDAQGRTSTAAQEVEITNLAPVVEMDDVVVDFGQVANLVLRISDPSEIDQQSLTTFVTSTNANWQTLSLPNSSGPVQLQLYDLAPGVYPLTARTIDKDLGEGTATATLTVVGDGTPAPPADPPPVGIVTCDPSVVLDGEERAFLDALNAYRAQAGAPPLEASPGLTISADRHADDMAANGFLDHIGSDGSEPGQRAAQSGYPTQNVDETILAGLEGGQNALSGWMASPAHNATLLNPLWNAVGIARSEGSDWYWVADFGELLDCGDTAQAAPIPATEAATLLADADETRRGGEALAQRAPAFSAQPTVMSYLAGSSALSVGQVLSSQAVLLMGQVMASSVAEDYGPTTALWVSKVDVATGEVFTIRNQSYDDRGAPLTAIADFGDGRMVELGAGDMIGHGYAVAGTYEVTLSSSAYRNFQTRTNVVSIEIVVTGEPVDPGSLPGNVSDPQAEPDFDVVLSPIAQVMNPGTSVDFVVSIVAIGGFRETVDLTLGALPDGVTGRILPNPVTFDIDNVERASLEITVDADVDLAEFDIEVTATSGDITHVANSTTTLDFGLVPVCYGSFTGRVYDLLTGETIYDATVLAQPVDENGRYFADRIGTGQNNEPGTRSISANAPGYWTGGASGLSECGRTTEVDIPLHPVLTGAMSGRVTIGEVDPNDSTHSAVIDTGVPLQDARVNIGTFNDDFTDANGFYYLENLFLTGPGPRRYSPTGSKEGYWGDTPLAQQVYPGGVTNVDIVLVPMCYTGDIHFTVRYPDGTPAAFDEVVFDGFPVTLDESGHYFRSPMEMGYNNAPRSFTIVSPHSRWLPNATITVDHRFTIDECGQSVDLNVLASPRIRNTGSFQGTVVDAISGEPIEGARVRIQSPFPSPPSFSVSVTTDENGIAREEDRFYGWDDVLSRQASVSATADGYYGSGGQTVTLRANDTVEAFFEMYPLQYGTVQVYVRDATTGEPVPDANVTGVGSLTTDENGLVEFVDVPITTRDVPRTVNVRAFKEGYWNSDSVRSAEFGDGDTVVVELLLLPICEGATVQGSVYNAVTREPIEGASVYEGFTGTVITDVFGRYELADIRVGSDNAPRYTSLTASATGFITQTKQVTVFCGAQITLEFGSANSEVGAIEGYVTNESGEPLEGVFIGSGFGGADTTDSDGYYSLSEVPLAVDNADRDWTVTADPDDLDAITQSVTVSGGTVSRLDFVFGDNQPPVADAGPDQNIGEGMTATLDGSASTDPDGDLITYVWTFTSVPELSLTDDTDLLDASTPMPSFIPDVPGLYTLELVVSDGLVDSLPDSVDVEVAAANVPPNANAGPDQMAHSSDVVSLDGSASFDPDGGPQPLSYQWTFVSVPSGSAIGGGDLAGATTSGPSFRPDVAGQYTLELVVDDGEESDSDSVTIEVLDPNVPPNARAGEDQTVLRGEVVFLDGTTSDDPDGSPLPLTFSWRFVSVPEASSATDADIVGSDTATPSFLPLVVGAYVLQLAVGDGEATSSDNVMIEVMTENAPPVADAGADQNVETGGGVTLDGTGSFDPDGDLIGYVWSFESVPAGSALSDVDLQGADTAMPTFMPDVDGSYLLSLVVTDAELASEPDTVRVVAMTPNIAPNADAGPTPINAMVGERIELDGSASLDPDAGPQPLTYEWTLVSAPVASGLSTSDLENANAAVAAITPDAGGTYGLALRVFDGLAADVDGTELIVQVNTPPNADAGDDQAVLLGAEVTLDGTGSHDPDAGPAPLIHQWRFVSVPAGSTLSNVDIADAMEATTQFTPDAIGVYVIELEVYDGAAADFDNTSVVVSAESGDLDCSTAFATPAPLWPPIGDMKHMRLEGLSGPNDTPVRVEILGITQDERVGGTPPSSEPPKKWRKTDGGEFINLVAAVGVSTLKPTFEKPPIPEQDSTCPDGLFLNHEFKLRRERSGAGDGRIYRVQFEATAVDGATCQGVVKVCAPLQDPTDGSTADCIEGGQYFDSTICSAAP